MTSKRLVLAAAGVAGLGAAVGLGVLYTGSARAAVGPLPGEALLLPADARFVGGVDVKRLTQSAFWAKYVHGRLEQRPQAFRDLEEKTGLDPERDIEQIVVAGSPRGTRGEGGIVLALGRFDRAKLSRAIETEKKGVTSKAVGGVTAYLFNEGQRGAGAVAFLDDRTLVVGTQAAVEGAIQSAAEGGKSLRRNETILRLLEQVRPDATFWMVGDQSVLENLPQNVPSGGQQVALAGLRNVSVSGDLEPAISVEINGEAQDEASAKNLADVVRGLVALASLQASQRPELKELAAAVSVASDAQRVRVSARFPYELLDQLHKQAGAGKPGAEDGAAR